MTLQNSSEIPRYFCSHEYASMLLDLAFTSRFHVCCKTPLVYKKKIKSVGYTKFSLKKLEVKE